MRRNQCSRVLPGAVMYSPLMVDILLTHTPAARDLYFCDEALATLTAAGTVHRHTGSAPLSVDELIAAAAGCQIIVADRSTAAPAALFDASPDLVYYARAQVDVRPADIPAASRNGVLVTNASPGFVDAVAELVVGFMVDLARGITAAAIGFRTGEPPAVPMGRQLSGSILGIVGYGRIGRRLAALANALDMTVLVSDPYVEVDNPHVAQVSFADLLARSHFVVCLAIANAETDNMFDAAAFAAMQPGAVFINPSRGELVDDHALVAALTSGHVAAAALDVGRGVDQTPAAALARLPQVIATPHIGGLTPTAIAAQAVETAGQVADLIAGRVPHNALNLAAASRLSRLGIDAPASA